MSNRIIFLLKAPDGIPKGSILFQDYSSHAAMALGHLQVGKTNGTCLQVLNLPLLAFFRQRLHIIGLFIENIPSLILPYLETSDVPPNVRQLPPYRLIFHCWTFLYNRFIGNWRGNNTKCYRQMIGNWPHKSLLNSQLSYAHTANSYKPGGFYNPNEHQC